MKITGVISATLMTIVFVTGSARCALGNAPDSYSIKLEESTKYINNQAKEIERKIPLPIGFPRAQINEEIYLYFLVDKNGKASDFRPLKYEKQMGLTSSQYATLLTVMATAIKQAKIDIPRDPVGPPPYWLVFKISASTAMMNVVIEAPPKRPMPKIVAPVNNSKRTK